MASPPRVLLLGLGNDLLTDDAVGLRVAGTLAQDERLRSHGVKVLLSTEMGLALLDLVTGYDKLVIIDSIQTEGHPPGHVHQIGGCDLPALPAISPHFLGIGEMLELGRQLGLQVPAEVVILAIEVADPYTVGTKLTPALEAALPDLVDKARTVAVSVAEAKSRDLTASD